MPNKNVYTRTHTHTQVYVFERSKIKNDIHKIRDNNNNKIDRPMHNIYTHTHTWMSACVCVCERAVYTFIYIVCGMLKFLLTDEKS